MTFYSKLIASVVGMLTLLASKYGIDLEGSTQLITDAFIAIATAVAVYLAKNTPATPDQLKAIKEDLPTQKEISDS